jgi:malate dehydrogenase
MDNFKTSIRRLNVLRNQLVNEINKDPVRILITGAAGHIGYHLAFTISQGNMFGNNQSIILHLFHLQTHFDNLKGLAMELTDGAFRLLKGIVYSSDLKVAFNDIDYAILCGARPRSQGMERKDLLIANARVFEEQGRYLNDYAKRSVKICVVGNPANTNCLILSKSAPNINIDNFPL